MDFVQQFGLAALACLLVAGCEKTNPPSSSMNPPPPPPPSPTPNTLYLDHAQPKLATMKLWLGPQELVAELAVAPVEVATGMMYRKEMAENEGMLFVFHQPHRVAFYMRNTVVPLSCAYIAGDGTILEIHDLQPLDERSVEANTDEVQFVLEVKQGWFDRHQVRVGTLVRTQHGSLQETFFRKRQ